MIQSAGLSVRAYDESKALQEFFSVISVTEDRDGAFYVSTMEARKVRVEVLDSGHAYQIPLLL